VGSTDDDLDPIRLRSVEISEFNFSFLASDSFKKKKKKNFEVCSLLS